MNQTNFKKDIPATILTQIEATDLGTVEINEKVGALGFSPLALLGAHDFVYTENSVTFGIKVKKDFNKVVITLNEGTDSYDVELWNCRILSKEPYIINEKVDEYNDVYCGELGHLLVREALH